MVARLVTRRLPAAPRTSETGVRQSRHLVGLAMVAASQTIFGSLGLFYKFALAGGASSLTILALRFPLAAVPLWALILVTGRRAKLPRRRALGLIGMGGGFYVGQSFFYLASLEYLPLSTATLLLLIYPGIVLVAALVLGRERPTLGRLLALSLSLVGAALVVGTPGQAVEAFGVALALTSSFIYSGYVLIGDRLLRGIDPLVASGYILASAGLGFIILAFAFGAFSLAITSSAWMAILTVAWFCTVFGVTGFLAGLPRVGPSAAAIAGTLEPLTAVLLGTLVLGERLGVGAVLGGVCILAAVVLLRKPAPVRASSGAAARTPGTVDPV